AQTGPDLPAAGKGVDLGGLRRVARDHLADAVVGGVGHVDVAGLEPHGETHLPPEAGLGARAIRKPQGVLGATRQRRDRVAPGQRDAPHLLPGVEDIELLVVSQRDAARIVEGRQRTLLAVHVAAPTAVPGQRPHLAGRLVDDPDEVAVLLVLTYVTCTAVGA